jgi:hypothetical protein
VLTGFTDKEIISLLGTSSFWAKRACREILRRKDHFVPLLLGVLDEAINDPDPFINSDKEHHIPAALLLTQMRVTEAYPRLVSLIDFDEDDVSDLWGDLLTDIYDKLLRDTFNGDAFLVPALLENRSVSPWSRIVAVQAWAMHYFDGRISREEITGCFRHLIHEVYTGEPDEDDETVLSYIADCIREQQLEELIEDVKSVYARGGIDTYYCGDSDKYIEEFHDPIYKAEDKHFDDAIKELDRWHWFEEEKSTDEDDDSYDADDEEEETGKKYKVGRNEPCPCGSGKKYKNCCIGIF